MSEWQKVRLGDVSKGGRGYYGIGASAVPFDKDKYTYLRITDINDDGSLNKSDLKSVDAEDASNYLLSPNDVVFARTGNSTGRNYFYDGRDGKFVYAGFLIKFSLDDSKINPKYVKYYLQSKEYWNWVQSFNTGSTRGNINAQTYANLEIPLLPIFQQNLISDILGSLDDKIELNNRMNANLEEQAQALFKRWFVDFEFPNEEGKPYRSSGGEMVESEMGLIPKGWKVETLGEVASFISRGITPKYSNTNSEIVLNQKCIRDHKIIFSNARNHTPKQKNDKWLEYGDVLINSTGQGTLGRVSQYLFNTNNVTVDSHITIVRSQNRKLSYFLGYNLLSREKEIEFLASGSTGQTELSKVSIQQMNIVYPNTQTVETFNRVIKPISNLMITNQQESLSLAQLRDTLLPKLMSGEVEV